MSVVVCVCEFQCGAEEGKIAIAGSEGISLWRASLARFKTRVEGHTADMVGQRQTWSEHQQGGR